MFGRSSVASTDTHLCTSARALPGGGSSLDAARPAKRVQRYSQIARLSKRTQSPSRHAGILPNGCRAMYSGVLLGPVVLTDFMT